MAQHLAEAHAEPPRVSVPVTSELKGVTNSSERSALSGIDFSRRGGRGRRPAGAPNGGQDDTRSPSFDSETEEVSACFEVDGEVAPLLRDPLSLCPSASRRPLPGRLRASRVGGPRRAQGARGDRPLPQLLPSSPTDRRNRRPGRPGSTRASSSWWAPCSGGQRQRLYYAPGDPAAIREGPGPGRADPVVTRCRGTAASSGSRLSRFGMWPGGRYFKLVPSVFEDAEPALVAETKSSSSAALPFFCLSSS